MKKRELTAPPLTTLSGKLPNYPEGWVWDWSVLVRMGFKAEEEGIKAGGSYEFTIPNYAVLTFHGRAFKLEFTKEYAAKKGYASTMEGNWG